MTNFTLRRGFRFHFRAGRAGPISLIFATALGLSTGLAAFWPGQLAAQQAAQQADNMPEIPVASLNGETLYLRELVRLAEQLPAQYQQIPFAQLYGQLIDELIDTRLAATAGREAAIDQRPEVAVAVRLTIDKLVAEIWLGQALSEQVDEAAIGKAYDAYVADAGSREEVNAAHILVEDEQTAKDIITALDGGAEFASLAKEKSTGPSGPNGGDLGYFKRGAMVPGFENAAFALEVGAYTKEPVQTQFGWHIIELKDRRTAEPMPLAEMAGQLRQTLQRQALVRVLEQLRVGAEISTRSFEEVRAEIEAAQIGNDAKGGAN
jgi:peptidyl-prolyl cis-trans isomerase C